MAAIHGLRIFLSSGEEIVGLYDGDGGVVVMIYSVADVIDSALRNADMQAEYRHNDNHNSSISL